MTRLTRVKICGITTKEDAWTAIDLGADGLGFLVGLLYESGDELTASEAGKIVEGLPPFVSTTLVTHRAKLREVIDLCAQVRPQVVQLHGPYPLDQVPPLREAFPTLKIIKAVHVAGEGESEIATALAAARHADAILLDTKTATRIGGTGVTHDWSVSRRIRDAVAPTPTILAGGLTPANVARAIEQVTPYAVDVNSGVSVRRGKKSPQLVEEFVRAAKPSR